jgi:glycosyltransferase involved in cell wall biosynthesis
LVTSRYSGQRAQEYYGLKTAPRVVPELIDLGAWRRILPEAADRANQSRFTVLYAGRMYRRKRVDLLLRAVDTLRGRIPSLAVRIVGDGPEARRLHSLSRELNLAQTVTWLGYVSRAELAAEYRRADVFCLPSVQEGFGIVLLEAMAAATPIVAARAAAIPEVVPHGLLVDPESAAALAAGIEQLHGSPETRRSLAEAGAQWVEQFDAPRVAKVFLEEVRAATGNPR